MRLLDLTLSTPDLNLALDEALLLEAEGAGRPRETLRLWELAEPLVVLGSSSRIALETRIDACRRDGVPILRRTSGGAAIVTGPGCLMYSLVLSTTLRPELQAIDRAHRFALDRLVAALRPHVAGVTCRGTSDLAIDNRKFSGNSLRCKRTHLLYHGTLLYAFPLEKIAAWLATPPRQPDYRLGRNHGEFVMNLPLEGATLRQAVIDAFAARGPSTDWPRDLTHQLAAEKFRDPKWIERL